LKLKKECFLFNVGVDISRAKKSLLTMIFVSSRSFSRSI